MAEVTTIARPYAEALFRLADENHALAAWSTTLAEMAVVASNADVRAVIANPNIEAPKLVELFMSLCKDATGNETRNTVELLVKNGRLDVLPEIRALFEELKDKREGVVEAEIVSAFPLDDAQRASLVADLERKFKRKVQAAVSTDSALIGGVCITIGDEVIDASVRGKLANMAVALKT
jgi:F-type H+-transporting ATPase subunit delta